LVRKVRNASRPGSQIDEKTLTFSPIGVLENGTVFLGREEVEKAVRALVHVMAHRW
jgi:hypothetical protein